MGQYQIGTVNVTNGSAIITGNGTLWLETISISDLFMIRDASVHYTVLTVDSNIQITLSANYVGATATYQSYQIIRNFTTNYSFPEIEFGDFNWPYIVTEALILVDTQIRTLADRIETKPVGTTTTTSTTSSTTTTTSTTSTTSSTTSSTSSTISTTSSTSSTISTTSTTTTTSPP